MSTTIAGADEYQKKLYRLIWKRTVASQMAPAKVQKTTITLEPSAVKQAFIAKGEVLTFDGFLAIYDVKERGKESILPSVAIGDGATRKKVVAQEQFTKPPARYTEASLVKKLEEL
jgi:DNA topoisomerase-1